MLTSIAVSLALGALATLLGYTLPQFIILIRAKTHSNALATAADIGGHVAYGMMVAGAQVAGGGGDFALIQRAAITAGITAVRNTMLPALTKLSDPALSSAVEAGLGAALKADQTVSAVPILASMNTLAAPLAPANDPAPVAAASPLSGIMEAIVSSAIRTKLAAAPKDISDLQIPTPPSQAAAVPQQAKITFVDPATVLPVVSIARADPAAPLAPATESALHEVAAVAAASLATASAPIVPQDSSTIAKAAE